MTHADPAAAPPRVQLLTRPGCHLCETARAALEALLGATEAATAMYETDITTDPHLLQRYGHEVPVVLVDGTPVCVFKVDAKRVRAALRDGPAGRRRWWRA